MVLTCPFCEIKVNPGQRICTECDQVIARFCTYCADEISVTADQCKYCGENIEPQVIAKRPRKLRNSGAAAAVVPSQIDVEFVGELDEIKEIEFLEDAAIVAWEEPTKQGVFRRWWSTFWSVNTKPAQFFREMPREGGTKKSLSFVFMSFLQVLLLVELVAIPMMAVSASHADISYGSAPAMIGSIALAAVIGFPLLVLMMGAGLIVITVFYHDMLRLLGGKASFGSTMRVLAYSSSATMWGLLPGVGTVMAIFIQPILHYHGFREVHGLTKIRAFFMAILPWLVMAGVIALAVATPDCGYR